ncbi:MAG TPA: hypothetical protein VHW23_30470 [Kofleriaceae bacterium]|nr:hypothetical protein [Kofleriaceae bacterium]
MLRTLAVVLALVVPAASAHGNPAGDVTSTSPAGTGAAVRFEADYEYDVDTADIGREQTGAATDSLSALPVRHELDYHQSRQQVTPRAELGVYRDLWVSFAAPIVLAQSSELDLASGVDRTAASTFLDGILPATGFDARSPTTQPGGNLVFHSVTRSGVPELQLGVGFAPMNQARDDTRPTWKVGVDLHLAIGRVMRFDAVDPGRQTGVSTGVHQLRLWTSFDRRLRYFEGWFEASYQVPIYIRSASLFQDPGFGATHVAPSQTGGVRFGLEANLMDDAAADRHISAEFGSQITMHLQGREYTEMWEAFALAGDRRTAGPLVLDADPVNAGVQAESYPGVSNVENYLETTARLAVRARFGPRLSFAAFGQLAFRTDHVISFAEAGLDLPTCPTGAPRCETDDNDVVNPGTAEVNPLHVKKIDLVGHRYRADNSRGYVLGLEAHFAF